MILSDTNYEFDLYTRITARLSEAVRTTLDQLLTVAPGETHSMFDKLKPDFDTNRYIFPDG